MHVEELQRTAEVLQLKKMPFLLWARGLFERAVSELLQGDFSSLVMLNDLNEPLVKPSSHHPAEQTRLCEAVRYSPATSLGALACHYFYRLLPIHTQTNYSGRAGNIPNFEQLTKGSSPPLGDVAYTVLTGF